MKKKREIKASRRGTQEKRGKKQQGKSVQRAVGS